MNPAPLATGRASALASTIGKDKHDTCQSFRSIGVTERTKAP